MIPVTCNTRRQQWQCTQVLFRIAPDFTGTIEIKCPRCRAITTHRFVEGTQHVA